jgi:hypothetical protein
MFEEFGSDSSLTRGLSGRRRRKERWIARGNIVRVVIVLVDPASFRRSIVLFLATTAIPHIHILVVRY